MKNLFNILILFCLCLTSCHTRKPVQTEEIVFNADSAYHYIEQQTLFGARIPGTPAHAECEAYLVQQLRRYTNEVEIQEGQMRDFQGKMQPIRNIVAHFKVENSLPTVLLCAHWDSRPWADEEEEVELRRTPILGADDGASGVGVLLEIARQLANKKPRQSIDIIFFDCEDRGTPSFYTERPSENSWCLGSQLWANTYKTLHQGQKPTYSFGILLDMVGAPDAVFPKEQFSRQYAGQHVAHIWHTAKRLGYANYFINQDSYPITDDHFYVNTIADIPCVDIIHYNMQRENGFPPYWHTLKDDMRNISKPTLEVVGKTILAVL